MTALAIPALDRARVLRTVAGHWPFRPEGFRVEAETIAQTTVVHNYGHGGCGVSLSWGTAELAVALANEPADRHAVVIGSGVVGLTTARLLQDDGFAVTIHGDAQAPAARSDHAGALWGVFSLVDAEHATAETGIRIEGVARASYRHFASLDPERYGVRRMPLYLVGGQAAPSWEMALTPELYPYTVLEEGHHPFHGRVLRTEALAVDTARLLDALREDVVRAGANIVDRRFASVEEILALGAPLVFNCTGLGARALFGDDTMVPVKGEHVVLDAQPGIDYAVVSLDDGAWMLPGERALVVGGAARRGDWSTTVAASEVDAMLDAVRRLYR